MVGTGVSWTAGWAHVGPGCSRAVTTQSTCCREPHAPPRAQLRRTPTAGCTRCSPGSDRLSTAAPACRNKLLENGRCQTRAWNEDARRLQCALASLVLAPAYALILAVLLLVLTKLTCVHETSQDWVINHAFAHPSEPIGLNELNSCSLGMEC